jgi:ATP-dependent protease ClpP protease subunit
MNLKKWLVMGALALALIFVPIGCTNAPLEDQIVQSDYTMHFGVPKFSMTGSPLSFQFKTFLDWAVATNQDKVIIEIHTTGGPVPELLRIVNYMDWAKRQGVIIETRVYGFALSAGFLIFVNGSKGHRLAHNDALFMIHSAQGLRDEVVRLSNKMGRKMLKNAGVPLELAIKWTDPASGEIYLTTAEMHELGLVDGGI